MGTLVMTSESETSVDGRGVALMLLIVKIADWIFLKSVGKKMVVVLSDVVVVVEEEENEKQK